MEPMVCRRMDSPTSILGAVRSLLWLCTRMCHPLAVQTVVEAMEALIRVTKLTRVVVVDNTQAAEVVAVVVGTAAAVPMAGIQAMVMEGTASSKQRGLLAFGSWLRS
jgi:hypothetical protein